MAEQFSSKILTGWSRDSIGSIPPQLYGNEFRIDIPRDMKLISDLRRLRNLYTNPPRSLSRDELSKLQRQVDIAITAECFRFSGYTIPSVPTVAEILAEVEQYYETELEEQSLYQTATLPSPHFAISWDTGAGNSMSAWLPLIFGDSEGQRIAQSELELLKNKRFFSIGLLSRGVGMGIWVLLHRLYELYNRGEIKLAEAGDLLGSQLGYAAAKPDDAAGEYSGGISLHIYEQIIDAARNHEEFSLQVTLADDNMSQANSMRKIVSALHDMLVADNLSREDMNYIFQHLTMQIAMTTVMYRFMPPNMHMWMLTDTHAEFIRIDT